MATALTQGTLFPAELTKEVFSLVKGESALAALTPAEPIPFNGTDVFTFSLDGEVSIVGENAAKTAGKQATIAPVQIRPIKVTYMNRVSDEFLNASEEAQINILEQYADGFKKKIAKALDIMAISGVNPATNVESETIGNNCFLKAAGNLEHTKDADVDIDELISDVDGANGFIIGATLRNEMAALKGSGKAPAYPEFRFGNCPKELGCCKLERGKNLDATKALALAGDFNAFKWGFSEEIPLKVIEYGDPDNAGTDLQNVGQVCLKAEAYIGWGILDKKAFKILTPKAL